MADPLLSVGIPGRLVDVLETGEEYNYSFGVKAKCTEIQHDVPNCAWDLSINLGWDEKSFWETVFYATDCGSLVGIDAPGRDLYLIEGNYKEDELRKRMEQKMALGEFAYESRVEATHLSVEQALRFLSENAGSHSKYMLVHQHKE